MSLPVTVTGAFLIVLSPGSPAPEGDRPWVRIADGSYVAYDGCGEGTLSTFPATVQKCGNLDSPRRKVVVIHSPADRNADGAVNLADMIRFLKEFGAHSGDWDGNGAVDAADLVGFLSEFAAATGA